MKRLEQMTLVGAFVGFSWLAMQIVHECGHVLGAVLSGGTVMRVVLHPLVISRTDVFPNPHPLVVAWAGPIVGILLPLAVYMAARFGRVSGLYLFRFFAGFCLIANGAYIGIGAFRGYGDPQDMLNNGSSHWLLVLFGVLAYSLGMYLWNGLGPSFGLGDAQGRVSRSATIAALALLVAVVGIEIIVF